MKRGWMIGMAAGILAGLIAGCGAAGGGKAESVPEPSAAQAAETEPVTVQVRVLCESARAEVELELPEGVSYDRSWEAELFDVTEGREKERLGTVRTGDDHRLLVPVLCAIYIGLIDRLCSAGLCEQDQHLPCPLYLT